MIKIGDSVICIKGYMAEDLINQKGNVIFLNKHELLVEFENNVRGHSGSDAYGLQLGKKGHCWWFPLNKYAEYLKVVNNELMLI